MLSAITTFGAMIGTGIAGFSWFGVVSAVTAGQPVDSSLWIKCVAGLVLLAVCLLKDGLLPLLYKAGKRTLKHLPALMPLLLIVGAVGGILSWKISPHLMPWHPDPANLQMVMVSKQLGHLIFGLVWIAFTYPLLNAAAIYCWQEENEGRTPNASQAYAFAKSRYKRMFGPHLKAVLMIQVGLLVVVPGILYGLWYAFVDPITATDDKSKKPLDRSRKLTQGRRGRILRAWLPYVVWMIPELTLPLLTTWTELLGGWAVAAFFTFNMLLLVWMKMVIFGLYEQRIADARKRLAAKKVKEEAAGNVIAIPVAADSSPAVG
jgi:hypothetical protein